MERLLPALRLLIASLAIACVLAGPAAAQDSQDLPDPNASAAEASGGGGLPSTGLPAVVLVMAGLSLMAGGVAVLPAARRRRTHSSFAWRSAVARARRG